MIKHQKHQKLARREQGHFSKNEISFLGSNCGRIKSVIKSLGKHLNNSFPIAYVDADHRTSKIEEKTTPPPSDFSYEFMDKITHLQYRTYGEQTSYPKSAFFYATYLSLINGNHFQGVSQIIIIDSKKEASLIKRKASLTHVIALIGLVDKHIPDYIQKLIPNSHLLPFFLMTEETRLADFIKDFMNKKEPSLNGLILGGGKSTRMGHDKLFLTYHEKPQYEYLQSLLNPFCNDVFVSCKNEQSGLFSHPLADTFYDLGAYGGILSAFRKNPNVAWFSVACDIPLLNRETLKKLVEHRNPAKMATCFYNTETKFPEPLITIWEPQAYPVLLYYLSLGYTCARKVLINNPVEIVHLQDDTVLFNANTVQESLKAKEMLSASKIKQSV